MMIVTGLVWQQLICQVITGESSSTLYLKTFNIQLHLTLPGTDRVITDLHFIIFTKFNVDIIHVVFLHRLINGWSQ